MQYDADAIDSARNEIVRIDKKTKPDPMIAQPTNN